MIKKNSHTHNKIKRSIKPQIKIVWGHQIQ